MTDKERPPLSEGQRELMEIVWDLGEASVFEVRDILGEKRELSRTTVRTMLERMEEKGWLTHRVIGRTHFYVPQVPREASLGQRVVEIIEKACGGKPERLMTALLEYRGLSAAEVKRIQEMLENIRAQKPKHKGGR